MKKSVCLILIILFMMVFVGTSFAASYTLPEKMSKQLQAGSGLYGSFVIHGNADTVLFPLFAALQNAEYEIVGIKTENYLHYHIFQSEDPDTRNVIAEFLHPDDRFYFKSDLLDSSPFLIPDADQIINGILDIKGDNQPVFYKLLKMILSDPESQDSSNAESLEKLIDLWISGFQPVTTVTKDDNAVPQLTEEFVIPMESMYNMVTEIVQYIYRNDSIMNVLRSSLDEEDIFLYFNPDLSYYYLEAMNQLNLNGDIVFKRTVSTMGEMLESSLTLPLDEARTGYSSLQVKNDAQRKSICVSGEKGIVFLELPLDVSFSETEYQASVRFVRVNSDTAEKNLALLIHIVRSREAYQDDVETKSFENDLFNIIIERDVSALPDGVSADQIPEMASVQANAELHYSSKTLVSRNPTTLEFSAKVLQGNYNYDITGKVKTASPTKIMEDYSWISNTFDLSNTITPAGFSLDEEKQLLTRWIVNCMQSLNHTPEEIKEAVAE